MAKKKDDVRTQLEEAPPAELPNGQPENEAANAEQAENIERQTVKDEPSLFNPDTEMLHKIQKAKDVVREKETVYEASKPPYVWSGFLRYDPVVQDEDCQDGTH
jgi:hypothetical protein